MSVSHAVRGQFVHHKRVRAVLDPDEYPPAGISRDDVTAQSESHRRHQIWNLVDLDNNYESHATGRCTVAIYTRVLKLLDDMLFFILYVHIWCVLRWLRNVVDYWQIAISKVISNTPHHTDYVLDTEFRFYRLY